jgi:hypothetical protein
MVTDTKGNRKQTLIHDGHHSATIIHEEKGHIGVGKMPDTTSALQLRGKREVVVSLTCDATCSGIGKS